jgi:hypothetical protein
MLLDQPGRSFGEALGRASHRSPARDWSPSRFSARTRSPVGEPVGSERSGTNMTDRSDTHSAGDPHHLSRFLALQEDDYAGPLGDPRRPERSHWIWYIFPQIDGLASLRPRSITRSRALRRRGPHSLTPSSARGFWNARKRSSPSRADRDGDLRLARRPETAVVCDPVRVRVAAGVRVRPAARKVLRGRRDDRTLHLLGIGPEVE